MIFYPDYFTGKIPLAKMVLTEPSKWMFVEWKAAAIELARVILELEDDTGVDPTHAGECCGCMECK